MDDEKPKIGELKSEDVGGQSTVQLPGYVCMYVIFILL